MAHRLIIVPGDNEVLRSLQGNLNDDIEVQMLETANDALWEVRNAPPEVIVADIDLPGMSGMDLAEILPNFGLPTRVILCSRQPDPRAAKQAQSHGVYQFLDALTDVGVLKEALLAAISAAPVAPAPEPEPEPAAPEPAAPEPEPAPRRRDPEPRAARRDPEPATRPEPAPRPPMPTPAPRKPGSRRNALVLTADNLTPIRSRMSDLLQEVGAQCILLSNREGMVLTEVGSTSGLSTMVLLPLLSTSFSAAGQISQMLRERDSSALYMQEGSHFDLYCFDMAQQFMLVLIFDKAASATKIGTAWVYTKRAIRDMLEYLS
ncbi:response regulator [Chloroflexia bacterium SDU3-3]|nr:response regulator [Chloroflexia bacterium SDU3-3]